MKWIIALEGKSASSSGNPLTEKLVDYFRLYKKDDSIRYKESKIKGNGSISGKGWAILFKVPGSKRKSIHSIKIVIDSIIKTGVYEDQIYLVGKSLGAIRIAQFLNKYPKYRKHISAVLTIDPHSPFWYGHFVPKAKMKYLGDVINIFQRQGSIQGIEWKFPKEGKGRNIEIDSPGIQHFNILSCGRVTSAIDEILSKE